MKWIKIHKSGFALSVLAVLCLLVFFYSLSVGWQKIYMREVAECLGGILRNKIFGTPKTFHPQLEQVILRNHLPRALTGAVVGAALSAAGTVYQGIFRNPKVSPDFLGASTGAGFGAAIAIFWGWGTAAVMANSFIFGLAAVFMAYTASLRGRGNPEMTLLLAGIMVGALFDSALSYLEAKSDPYTTLPDITFWLMGSLVQSDFKQLNFALPWIMIGFVLLFFLRWPVNLMAMGDDEARTMGTATHLVRGLAIVAATLITAASVSVSGKIGWIGLVIPHFSRMLVGHDCRVLLPVSMLMGSAFLMLIDIIARYGEVEFPLGILTAVVGAPFFIYLLLSRKNKMAR